MERAQPGEMFSLKITASGSYRQSFRRLKAGSQKLFNAILHLFSRLIRKGNRQDRLRRDAFLNEMQNSVGDDPSFPRSGSRDDEKRSVFVPHGCLLSLIQSFKMQHSVDTIAQKKYRIPNFEFRKNSIEKKKLQTYF